MIELIQLWQIQSQNVAAEQNANSLFIGYVVLCLIIKRPVFLLAFLLPEMLFQLAVFDFITNVEKYLIEIVLYTFVFEVCSTLKSKACCVIIVITTIIFALDEYLFGLNGVYGESYTFIYNNISIINTCVHSLLIASLIPYRRILNGLRDFISSIMYVARNSYFI